MIKHPDCEAHPKGCCVTDGNHAPCRGACDRMWEGKYDEVYERAMKWLEDDSLDVEAFKAPLAEEWNMTDTTTSCWDCSKSYGFSRNVCPHCKALNANQATTDQVDAQQEDRRVKASLLEALEIAVRLNSFREFNDHIPAMRAAIAKARGEA